ncbi:MAG: acyloxyacyl hydrolase [Bacteroidota bacterium]|nr:acyloxyacyl hydrolase [Bacteroidota bacterium]
MRQYFIIGLVFFLIFFSSNLYSQTSLKDRLYIEANYHYGFVMPHLDPIAYFINEHVNGYQVNVGILSTGKKKWQQDYNYPLFGLGFYHSGLGNTRIFGQVNALFCYVDRYFFRYNSRFNLGNRLEFGLGYINRKFDLQNNYFDIAIGSHLNTYLNYSLEGLIRIQPQLTMKIGVGMSHVSNGRFSEPNKGLNFLTTFAGFEYSFKEPLHYEGYSDIADDLPEHQFIVTLGGGEKQISRRLPDRYAALALSTEYSRKIFRNGYAGLSLNTYYDPSLIKEIELEGDTAKSSDCLRLSLNLSYEMKMGHISYLFQPGIYLKNAYSKIGNISNRIGIRYQIDRHWLAGVTIKAHWIAIADFIEWGVGYRIAK